MKHELLEIVLVLHPHVFNLDLDMVIVRLEAIATDGTVERGHRCITLPIAMNAPQTDHVVPRQSAKKNRSLIGLTALVEDQFIESRLRLAFHYYECPLLFFHRPSFFVEREDWR